MSDYDDDTQPFGQYQGWTNWDTWDANLWLTNDEVTYLTILPMPEVEDIKDFFLRNFRDMSTESGWIDGVDPAKVNWQEIHNSLHEGE